MHQIKQTTVGLLGLSFLVLSNAKTFAAPSVKEIKFQWNGSGCAKSESSTPWDPMVVQVVASRDVAGEFQVKRGAGASPKDARKNCDLIVSSNETIQIALDRIEIKGSGVMPKDARLDIVVEASSQGAPGSKKYSLDRPKDETYTVTKSIDDPNLFWSACGRALLVSTKQTIKSGSTLDAKIENIAFNFQAKACKK